MTSERIRFAVLGPGGVGGLLAALLAREGDEVTVLAGDATARAIAAGGIRVESERFGTFAAKVSTAPELAHPVDAVLVTVKATQLAEALTRVPAETLGDALVVPFLNGLDHVEALRARYPAAAVVPATIRIETTRVSPGLVRHTSPFALVDIATTPDVASRVAAIAAELRATGLDVRIREDETAMLWDKFAVLAPLALLTTHARGNAGMVRSERRDDLIALTGEFAAVAAADGVSIDASQMVRFVDQVPDSMETSMQKDQAAGRALELDALGHALLRRAARAGVATPVTRRLVEEIGARAAASTSA